MNKGVSIEIADIYLRFPEIMEEEFEDLTEFIEDNHILYEGATDIVYNLKQENKELKEQLKQRDETIDELKEFLKTFHDYENRFKWCEEDYITTILAIEKILQRYRGDNK